jgi:type I restriction enzyme S subunit
VDADIVPDGWTLGQFAEIAQYVRSTVIPRQVNPDEPYIGLEHMPRRSIALYEWGKASDVISQKSRFTSGQILFGKLRPYFHKVGIAPTDGVCSTDILVLEASAPHWYGYTVMVASSISMIEHVTSLSDGTKMPRTKWEDVARFPIVLPHADVAEAFSMILSPILEYIKTAIFESKHLIEARDTLLPKLLAGELQLTS